MGHFRCSFKHIARVIFAISLLGIIIIIICQFFIIVRIFFRDKVYSIQSVNRSYAFSPTTKEVFRNIDAYPRDKARAPLSCWIILRHVPGRLGNGMFLFASAYGIARLHQCHLYIAPSILNDLRSVFVINITKTPINLLQNTTELENRTDVFRRHSSCTLFHDLLRVPLLQKFIRYELTGWYQAYGYFDRYREEVAQLFEFNQEIIRSVTPLVEQLVKSE
jgi:hypothetical protein